MTAPKPVRVLISYAHDPGVPGHANRALDLADSLRIRGVEAHIDRYVEHTGVFWPRWMMDEVRDADFVLCLVSPLYRERFEQSGNPTAGRGVRWEGLIITEELYYEPNGGPRKFLAVVMEGASVDNIPDVLHPYGYTHYCLPADDEVLYRRLTGQPTVVPPPLGAVVNYR